MLEQIGTWGDAPTIATEHGAPRPLSAPRPEGARFPIGAVLALTAAAVVVTFWGIGSKSLSRDEGFSASTSLRSWSSLARLSLETDTNGALYGFALKAWSDVFGTSEAALRSLSAVAIVALGPVVAALGWRLGGRRVALVGGLLVVANGSIITYGQQARTYGLTVLLAALATLVFCAEVARPRKATLAGWVVLVIALGWAHTVAGGALLFVHIASTMLLPPDQRCWSRRLPAAGLAGLALAPLPLLVLSHEEGQGLFSWRPGVFRDVLVVLSGRGGLPGFAAAAVVGLLAVRATRDAWRRPASPGAVLPRRWVHGLLLGWAVGPFILLVAGSLIEPMLIGRYLLFCIPGIAVYGAIGIDHLLSCPPRLRGRRAAWLTPVLVAIVAVGSVRGASYWLVDGGNEDWRSASQLVLAEAQPDDGLMFANDSVRLYFDYYRNRGGAKPTLPFPAYPSEPWGAYGTGDQQYRTFSASEAAAIGATTDRVWVLIGHDHVDTEGVEVALAPLAATHHLEQSVTFAGEVDVRLYVRRA